MVTISDFKFSIKDRSGMYIKIENGNLATVNGYLVLVSDLTEAGSVTGFELDTKIRPQLKAHGYSVVAVVPVFNVGDA